MTTNELNNAKNNPEFLEYLNQTQKDALQTNNIAALYEVLDSLLILGLDDDIERINLLYTKILENSFYAIEPLILAKKRLKLEDDGLFYVRAFYEHGIEKWSVDDFKGAKELFFVLANIVDSPKLADAFFVHIIACAQEQSIEDFYDTQVDIDSLDENENGGYFIQNFTFDTQDYLNQNKELLQTQYKNLSHLLEA